MQPGQSGGIVSGDAVFDLAESPPLACGAVGVPDIAEAGPPATGWRRQADAPKTSTITGGS
jgi:hypothetical protein